MSATLVEAIVEGPKIELEKPCIVPPTEVATFAVRVEAGRWPDQHPLFPVFIIGGIALIGAFAFIGSIVLWLALRHSGVMAP